MQFMALMLVRGPLLRDRVNAKMLELAQHADAQMAETPESFSEALEDAREAGVDIPTDRDTLERWRSLRLDDFRVTVPNYVFMQALFRGLAELAPVLSARGWALYRAQGAEFIFC